MTQSRKTKYGINIDDIIQITRNDKVLVETDVEFPKINVDGFSTFVIDLLTGKEGSPYCKGSGCAKPCRKSSNEPETTQPDDNYDCEPKYKKNINIKKH